MNKKRILPIIIFAVLLSCFITSINAESATAKLEEKYSEATLFMIEGDYNKAASLFEALGAYSDSSQMALYCKAINAGEESMYSIAIDALITLGDFKDSPQMIKYYQARELQEKGTIDFSSATDEAISKAETDITQAINIYTEIILFKDSKERIETCNNLISGIANERDNRLKSADVGSYIFFGHYYQAAGGDSSPIEWLVLENDGQKALLISRYVLDTHNLEELPKKVIWETSEMRKWLNNTFLNNAFTADEQKAILSTTVDNSKNQGEKSRANEKGGRRSGGNNTNDKIFFLSYKEAFETYFLTDAERIAYPTLYVENQTGMTNYNSVFWCLRSPGYFHNGFVFVNPDGSSNSSINSGSAQIRPCLWLDLNAIK